MTSRTPDNLRIYAIGDIHGRADLLLRLLETIEKDSATSRKDVKIVFLGDYVDRGFESRKVLDILIQLGDKPVFLKGNHDDVMLQVIRDTNADLAADWMMFGGREAAMSYGVMAPPSLDLEAMLTFISRLKAAVPQEHLDFLASLRSSISFGDYYFCHAGVRPGIKLDDQVDADLLWIRGDFMAHSAPFEKMIVHGHTVAHEPDVQHNRIGIDTGAYATGNLTALALEGDRQWFLHTA